VGYGLRAIKRGVRDRVEGYLERTTGTKFYLAIAYAPYGVTRKAALSAFEAFAAEALGTVDVSRTETKYWLCIRKTLSA